ncbi:LytR/AlgR family response regulator transcription factor [Hydrogenophaga pseudoflava]|uniref:Transcriptional regulatory protein YehT n=1 Tax=Hydrogenophaga pseudoflava TaxID=47421 RepID=A0A4P6X0N1_HYDPS|nr:LytTR family DNA-binding domain-containing protein [Hydrogenophaga pseudoflava]QBM29677.1 Transcriptional regulatory protein YehT [Hydrogenophaga pseudoflava]
MTSITALIAEDEPLLAAALRAELARVWPELCIAAQVGDGASAVRQALALRPEVLFLDIRMPGMTGLEAAAELAEEWPDDHPFPSLVFVTAYDQYAVQAFEAQAADYVLKPVVPERLARTVQRVQARLQQRMDGQASPAPMAGADDATFERLRALLAAPAAPALKVIQAGVGSTIRLVPVDEVLVFEAADKYVRVLTGEAELLIRTPLKDLLPQLDGSVFWQVHRGTVVRATAVRTVHRDEAGKLSLEVAGLMERVPVSRLYAGRFRAM